MPKVCIITVNYGTPTDTIECFESIIKSTFQDYLIVCVDVCNLNNSLNDLYGWFKNNTIHFHIIPINKNLGFAYANNVALKFARELKDIEYIWLLNNDTVIDKNALRELIEFHKRISITEKIGFLGSKVKYYNSPLIQSVGGSFNKHNGYSKLIGKNEIDSGQYDGVVIKPDYVIGASMFFRINLIEEIGFMPENYFLYYEDIDWCITAQEKGFTNMTCANSIIWHKQGITTGNKYNKNKTNLNTRKYMYISYLILYKRKFKNHLHIAYLILIKQLIGKMFRFKFFEALIILRTIIKNNKNVSK